MCRVICCCWASFLGCEVDGGTEKSTVDAWKVCCDELLSKDVTLRVSAWSGIHRASMFCPSYPRLKQALIYVLKDESRRDEWSQAFTNLSSVLECDPHLDVIVVKALLEAIPGYDGPTRHQAVGCFGALRLHQEIVISYLERLLTDETTEDQDAVASSILRLNGRHQLSREILLRNLRSDNVAVRSRAAFWIGRSATKAPDLIDMLRTCTRDQDSSVRVTSACALWFCIRSERDALPVLTACLSDAPSLISLRSSQRPNASSWSQHGLAIQCLGEMGNDSAGARIVLKQIANREMRFQVDREREMKTLITASGKGNYGARTYFEAQLAVAEHDNDPLRPAAIELIGVGKLDEFKRSIGLWRRSCVHECSIPNEKGKE